MESYGVEEARNPLGDLVLRVKNGEHIMLTRYGKPAVILVPVTWYEQAGGEGGT